MVAKSSKFKSIKDSLLDKLTFFVGKQGLSMSSYSDLDSPIDDYTFSAEGGRLGSMVHIKGLRQYAMTSKYQNMLDQLAIDLSSFFRNQKHMLQFTYTFDTSPKKVEQRLRELAAPSMKSMRSIGLDLEDISDANIMHMAMKFGVVTDLVVCVWTFPVGNVNTPTYMFPIDAHDTARGMHSSSVLDSHTSLVRKFVNVLGSLDVDASLLNINQALDGVRKRFNPTIKGRWSPQTKYGDAGFRQAVDERLRYVPDKLNKQVTPGYVEIPSFDDLYINDKMMVKSFDVLHFPRQSVTFEHLLNLLASADAPARLTFTITGGGGRMARFKKNSALLQLSTKSPYKNAVRYLNNSINNETVVVGLQLTASTWVEVPEGISIASKNPERIEKLHGLLNQNFEKLSTSFSNWGESEPDLKNDTPMYAWCRNNAGFNTTSQAHVSFAPIVDAFRLLPMFKMSPIWSDYGMKVMRTPQNELISMNRLAPNQPYSFTICVGTMRAGKSVKLGGDVFAMACYPGINELPYISFIDVGKTIFGTYEMIRDSLPEHKKNQVTTYELVNDAKHAINPFHLPMGLKEPTSEKRDFLINFIKMLVTDPETGTREGVEGVAARLIESTYKKFNVTDNTDRKRYGPASNKKLDMWLEEINYNITPKTSYWELFEYFFKQGDYNKAHLCQAYASPILPDFINVLNSPEFKAAYENDEESLAICRYMSRSLSDCLNLYPILSRESLLNMDETRMLALELGRVAKAGVGGIKTTAVMYFIALDLSVRNFFVSKDDIKDMPIEYQAYHLDKYERTKSLPKSLSIDELHKATGGDVDLPIAKQTMKILLDYVRVFSKKNIEFAVSTQMLGDITPELIDLSNIRVILSSFPNADDELIKKFNLDPSMKVVLKNLGKPTKDGSMMLIQNDTNDGNYTHVVYNSVSPEEIWGQVSNEIDVLVRDGAYKKLPRKIARKSLAKLFPECTAKRAAMDIGGEIADMSLETKTDVSDQLIAKVVQLGKRIEQQL